ncbi:nuclear transmembrane protein [Novymonas esmeraldas]|uniref:Nuclear transmembrane protein n=1 Tax=Novymonas esmeraldas TaxID=1808958 RepID=A0AAW0ELQ5_9TRYP
MELAHVIAVVFLNGVALRYALCAALLLAPLYALVLKPLVRWSRRRAAATSVAERNASPPLPPPPPPTAQNTPARVSASSSKGFVSPASIGATPSPFTPVFGTAAAAAAAGGAVAATPRGSTGVSPSPRESSPGARGRARPLEITGTALALEEARYRPPAQRLMAALRRGMQPGGDAATLNGSGDDDGTIQAAVQSGEVYLYRRPSQQLPSQDYLAMCLLQRQRLQEQYDKLNITDASLDALYARPAFHEWYAANREQLVREAHLHDSFATWRSVATAVVLVVAVVLLPAYSFSTQTDALQWATPLRPSNNGAATASAPLVQLLVARLDHIQSRLSAHPTTAGGAALSSRRRVSIGGVAAVAAGVAEYVGVVAAACALVTSCFMPRESASTASLALASFLVLVVESALVPTASVQLGLGFLVIFAIVVVSVYRAAA